MNSKPMWTEKGKMEKLLSMFLGISIVMFLGLGAGIFSLVWQNAELHKQIAFLERNRIMIGLPNERGFFISTDKIPTRQIEQYAHGFIVNCYNWRQDSVDENLDECQARMDEALVVQRQDWIEARKKRAKNQGIMTIFIPSEKRLEKTEDGFRYTVRGNKQRLVGRNMYYDFKHEVVVEMYQGQPTYFRPLGLKVLSWTDKCLDCK